MAGIDPSIALSVKPLQIESPINQMAAMAQLQGAQQQQQMNALKMQEYQQQLREKNALARIMSDQTLEFGGENFMRRVLAEAPGQYEAVSSRELQRSQLQENINKRKFEQEKLQADVRKQRLSELKDAQQQIAQFNTVEEVIADVENRKNAGLLSPEHAQHLLAGVPTDQSEFGNWKNRTLMNLVSAEKQLELTAPKIEKIDLNGVVKHIDLNPRSPTYGKEVLPEMAKVVSPAEQQRLDNEQARLKLEGDRIEEQTRHANAMERIGQAGADRAQLQLEETERHNKAMEKLRRAEINKPSAGENPNKVAHTSTDDQGNVTFYNAFGQVIRTEANAGKRSPNLIKQEQAEKNLSRDIERTSKELDAITQEGGLIDQSTGSYIGKAVDVGARVFGQATSGDIASAKLKPIADMVLKMVPRFEGPQSDKDTQSYKEAAGQLADSTLPREIRKEAGKTILRLMRERKDQFATGEMDMSPAQRKTAPPPPPGFVPDKK